MVQTQLVHVYHIDMYLDATRFVRKTYKEHDLCDEQMKSFMQREMKINTGYVKYVLLKDTVVSNQWTEEIASITTESTAYSDTKTIRGY